MHRPERFPPSEYLTETLRERGWTSADLAARANLPLDIVRDIMSGRQRITYMIARHLAAALDTSPDLWLNLQRGDMAVEPLEAP